MVASLSENGRLRLRRLHEALAYPCPFCGAKPGELCETAKGTPTYEHTARLILRGYVEDGAGPAASDASRIARLARKIRSEGAGTAT